MPQGHVDALDHQRRGDHMSGPHQAMLMSGGSVATVPAAISLYAALVSFWEFEENNAGTTYSDSHGANHLTVRTAGSTTATSVVTDAAGRVGRAFFGGNTADRTSYIPRSNTALDLPNSDWTVFLWMRGTITETGVTAMAWGRLGSGGGGSANVANIKLRANDNIIQATAWDNASASVEVTSAVASTGPDWTAVAFSLDRTNNLIRLRVNKGGTADNDSAAFANPLYTAASNANFCFNDWLYNDTTFNAANRHVADYRSDQACFFTKAISDDEFTYLVNSGAGKSYATLKAESGN
jgi:hypothetical protein